MLLRSFRPRQDHARALDAVAQVVHRQGVDDPVVNLRKALQVRKQEAGQVQPRVRVTPFPSWSIFDLLMITETDLLPSEITTSSALRSSSILLNMKASASAHSKYGYRRRPRTLTGRRPSRGNSLRIGPLLRLKDLLPNSNIRLSAGVISKSWSCSRRRTPK